MERTTGAVVAEPTFLSLVRDVAAVSRERCAPDCWISQHRRETASYIGIFYDRPDLVRALARAVYLWHAEAPDGFDPEEGS